MSVQNGGPPSLKALLLHGPKQEDKEMVNNKECWCPIRDIFQSQSLAGLAALYPPKGWSHIQIPGTLLNYLVQIPFT